MKKVQMEPLLDLIRKHEGGKAGYDAIVWKVKGARRKIKPTEMSVIQVLDWQIQAVRDFGFSAIGGYQIIRKTLLECQHRTNTPDDAIFDRETQDKFAMYLLERRHASEWLRNEMSDENFMIELAREWASFPVPVSINGVKAGQSYYAGDGTNKAGVSIDAVRAALRACKGIVPPEPSGPTKSEGIMPEWVRAAWRSLSPTGKTIVAVVGIVAAAGILLKGGPVAELFKAMIGV